MTKEVLSADPERTKVLTLDNPHNAIPLFINGLNQYIHHVSTTFRLSYSGFTGWLKVVGWYAVNMYKLNKDGSSEFVESSSPAFVFRKTPREFLLNFSGNTFMDKSEMYCFEIVRVRFVDVVKGFFKS